MGLFSLFKKNKAGTEEAETRGETADEAAARLAAHSELARQRAQQDLQRDIARATAMKIDAIEAAMAADIFDDEDMPWASRPARPPHPPAALDGNTLPLLDAGTTELLGETDTPAEAAAAETAPVVEEVALLYASGQAEVAAGLLAAAARDQRDRTVWWMLFDLYQILGRQDEFDSLSIDYASTFETSPPPWNPPAAPDSAVPAPAGVAPTVVLSGMLDAGSAAALARLHAPPAEAGSGPASGGAEPAGPHALAAQPPAGGSTAQSPLTSAANPAVAAATATAAASSAAGVAAATASSSAGAAAAATSSAAAAASAAAGAAAAMVASSLASARPQLEAATQSAPLRLDCSPLRGVTPEGCALLLAALQAVQAQQRELTVVGAAELERQVGAILAVGRRDEGEAPWLLRLELLRLQNREKDFEESSMDYCVTFEVSPPPFTPPRRVALAPGQPVAAVTAADRFALPAVLEGDSRALTEAILAYAGQAPALVFDCARLLRIDYGAAQQLLTALQGLGERRIEFRDLNHLVAALLRLLGAGASVRLFPHKY